MTQQSGVDLGALVALPLLVEVLGVVVRARLDAHEDSAALDARFVALDALFGDAPADQRPDQAARGPARTRTGDSCRKRTSDDHAKARNGDRRSDRCNCGDNRTQGSPNRASDACAFRGLRAELGLCAPSF